MFSRMSHKQIRNVVLGCLCLLTLLLAACRSASSTVEVKAEIMPEPIVGEIVTLRIETVSEKFSGDNIIIVWMSDEINLVSPAPEWQETVLEDESQGLGGATRYGKFVVDEPQTHELSVCVTQPGNWIIHVTASVLGDDSKVISWSDDTLHLVSTVDSAQVIPSSEYKVFQAPQGSTPTPTPMPVRVSGECSGEG